MIIHLTQAHAKVELAHGVVLVAVPSRRQPASVVVASHHDSPNSRRKRLKTRCDLLLRCKHQVLAGQLHQLVGANESAQPDAPTIVAAASARRRVVLGE